MLKYSFGRFLLLLLPILLPTISSAQDPINPTNTGEPLNASLHGSDIENVQLNNGNLHVDIPIWAASGRGLDATVHFIYDNKGWTYHTSCHVTMGNPVCNDIIEPESGNTMTLSAHGPWAYGLTSVVRSQDCPSPILHVSFYTNLAFISPDGTKHHLIPDPVALAANTCSMPVFPQDLHADDGSGFVVKAGATTWVLATDKHGTTYPLPSPGTVEDTNGNQLVGSNSTDTLNRSVGQTSYYDSSGALQSFVTTTTTVPILTSLCTAVRAHTGSQTCQEYSNAGWTVPSQITLPNSQSYSFTYAQNAMGEITSITTPAGAEISYTYVGRDTGGRGVATRTVTVGGVSSVWTYSPGTITDPLGNDVVFSCAPPRTGFYGDPCYISSMVYYQGAHNTGVVLKTVNTDYTSLGNRLFPIRETTTWNQQNLVRKVETDWASDFLNPSERREYDWGTGAPGALLRRTHYTYLHLQNSTYLNKNIADRPTSVIVYDGSGNIKAQTTTTYDGSALTGTSGVPNHDYTNFSTSNLVRGNPTTIGHWLNPGNTWLNTVNTFDDLGNLLTTADPLQHTTTFSYTDNWANTACVPSGVNTHGYVTQITNALSQNAQTSYYPCTGLAASKKDQNDINASRAGTTFAYDFFGRLTQKIAPDGAQTSVSYNDVPPVSNTTTVSINSTQSAITTKVFDGLGRILQTQLTSDPQGTVYTDTTYDLLGRVHTVSNPYRLGTDITTTAGITTFGYDALSRKTSVTYPDSSVLTTAYCGPSTLVTDPTNRWRRSRVDGLDNLVEVDEPNSSTAAVASTGCPGTGELIWVTSYGYDALKNLTSVLQNGSRSRAFTYDSFSRMLTSANPEVGTITYTYNPDGSVLTKKDARNITTTYSYDALHRTTQASYSDGTPIASYHYDETAPWGWTLSNPIGRKTTEYTNDSATGTMLTANLFSYDAMGRPLILEQCQPQNCVSAPSLSTSVSYDYAGNPTALTYPSGRVVRYTYDSADRSSTAADGSNGVTYATGFKTSPGGTCANNITCYTPQGTFYALSLGQTSSFNGVNLTHIYNSRLQPQEFKASSSGGNAIDITYNFRDPLNSNKNAGRVFSITNNLDSTRSQKFTYDQLNRITSALTTSTHATSPSHCWGETYALDAWANLNSIAATTNSAYTGCSQESGFSQTATSANRLPSFSYDLSGNASSDGVNAYTWDGESQLKTAAGMTYTYDVEGRRVAKSSGKTYVYGLSGEILAEVDASGHTTAEYIFFGGKRIATLPAGGNPSYYVEDLLGTSRVLTTNTGTVCYDADFYPYGGERAYTNTCQQNYKFEGKERDTETLNDDFGARYYSNRFGRWLSADWSAVPVAVPYANLSNPQTLNLYGMVSDDPESFADLDGHDDGPNFVDRLLQYFGLANSAYDTRADEAQRSSGQIMPSTDMTLNDVMRIQNQANAEAARQVQNFSEAIDPTGVFAVSVGRAGGLRSNSDVAMSFAGLGLSLGAGRAIAGAQNLIRNRFTTETFQAAAKEAQGAVVALRPDGKPFDHIGALREGLQGLKNSATTLTNALKSDSLTDAQRQALQSNLQQINKTINQTLKFFKKNNIQP